MPRVPGSIRHSPSSTLHILTIHQLGTSAPIMVLSKTLLTLGSLAASAVALPSSQRPLGDDGDDDNDTPLPLIIWHGEHVSTQRLAPPPASLLTTTAPIQVWATPTATKASNPLPPSPKPSIQALLFMLSPKEPIPTPTSAPPSGATSTPRSTSSATTSPRTPSSAPPPLSTLSASARAASSSVAGLSGATPLP